MGQIAYISILFFGCHLSFAQGAALEVHNEYSIELSEASVKDNLDKQRIEELKLLLIRHFEKISSSDYSSANRHITEAIKLFKNPEVPALLYLGVDQTGSGIYDQPESIFTYLNEIKFKSKFDHKIRFLAVGEDGLITKLILTN